MQLFYTAPTTAWDIGELGTDGTYLLWPEKCCDGVPTEGLVRRMPIGGGTPEDIAADPYLDEILFTDSLYVYFSIYYSPVPPNNAGIYRLPFDASALVRDLAADTMEVTQGIQNLNNTVPLVANKTTYVRAYGREDDGIRAGCVEAYLYGTRGGNPLPGSPLPAQNGTQTLQTGISFDRGDVDDGWIFQLPDAWTDPGTTDLRLVVDPRDLYNDPNPGNNELSMATSFTQKSPVCIVYVPVRTHSPNYSRPTDNPYLGQMLDVHKRYWPVHDVWWYYMTDDIAELECCWKWGFIPYPCWRPYEIPSDDSKILIHLEALDYFTDDPDECQDVGARTHYVGMIHPETNTGSELGVARLDGDKPWVKHVACVKFPPHGEAPSTAPGWPDAGTVQAHELGHNLGRLHVPCAVDEDLDPNYPYSPTCFLDDGDPADPATHFGFDIKNLAVIAPTSAADYMSYHRPNWSSDYTWKAIYNRLHNWGLEAASTQPRLTAAQSAVFVNGLVTPSLSTAALDYAWVYPTATLSTGILRKWEEVAVNRGLRQAGGYHIRLLDSLDSVLADYPITLTKGLDSEAEHPGYGFVATFPAPSETVARIELLQDGDLLHSRAPGTSVPTITVVKPAGGETFDQQMQLVWQASDADSEDTLLYSVQYSPDNGQSWIALLTNFPGPPDSTTVRVDLLDLGIPGSNLNEGLLRVAGSDGYNTALTTSAAFTVSNRAPEAYIVSPIAGETTPAGPAER